MWASSSFVLLSQFLCSGTAAFFLPSSPSRRFHQKYDSNYRRHQEFYSLSNTELSDIESAAAAAAEQWDTYTTPFLDKEDASQVSAVLENRADLGVIQIGGGSSRKLFVVTNPDMVDSLDPVSFCSVLKVDGVILSQMADRPWPNVLDSIGVAVDHVGDIVEFENESKAYLMLCNDVVKTCERLLPKELPGSGLTVSKFHGDDDEGVFTSIPEGGQLVQDMSIKRLDKRQQKQKK